MSIWDALVETINFVLFLHQIRQLVGLSSVFCTKRSVLKKCLQLLCKTVDTSLFPWNVCDFQQQSLEAKKSLDISSITKEAEPAGRQPSIMIFMRGLCFFRPSVFDPSQLWEPQHHLEVLGELKSQTERCAVGLRLHLKAVLGGLNMWRGNCKDSCASKVSWLLNNQVR